MINILYEARWWIGEFIDLSTLESLKHWFTFQIKYLVGFTPVFTSVYHNVAVGKNWIY